MTFIGEEGSVAIYNANGQVIIVRGGGDKPKEGVGNSANEALQDRTGVNKSEESQYFREIPSWLSIKISSS